MVRKLSRRFATNRKLIRILLFTFKAPTSQKVCESDVSRTDGVKRDPAKVRSLLTSLARNESTLAGSKSIDKDVGTSVSKNSVSR